MVDPLLMTLRVLFRRVHLIATLSAGLWLALSGLSGSLLVFGDALDPRIHPQLYNVEHPGVKAPIESALASARSATGGEIVRARLAGRDTPVHEVWINCDRCLRVWIDPSTGEVNGVRSHDGTFRLWLHEFHRRMMLGDLGETMVGLGGVTLLVITLSGIYLWFPRKWSRAFRLQLSRGWKVATHDLHRTVGIIVTPLFLISAATGIYFVFHTPIDRALAPLVEPGTVEGSELVSLSTGTTASLDDLVHRAEMIFPGSQATWLTPPSDEDGVAVVRLRQSFEAHPNGRTFLWVDSASGDVARMLDPGRASIVSRLINELYPLHIGRSGGLAHQITLVILGLMPTAFLATGLLMWWNRSLRARYRGGRSSSSDSLRAPALSKPQKQMHDRSEASSCRVGGSRGFQQAGRPRSRIG